MAATPSPVRFSRAAQRISHPSTGDRGGEETIMKTTRERAEEKRQAKLELIREQVGSGSLVIRKMTAEERRQYPPRPDTRKRSGQR
jgi:hypothetical protein